MLKIKDEVDLNKLNFYKLEYDDSFGKWIFCDGTYEYISINSWNRKIIINSLGGSAGVVLLMLINAGFVEAKFDSIDSIEKVEVRDGETEN